MTRPGRIRASTSRGGHKLNSLARRGGLSNAVQIALPTPRRSANVGDDGCEPVSDISASVKLSSLVRGDEGDSFILHRSALQKKPGTKYGSVVTGLGTTCTLLNA